MLRSNRAPHPGGSTPGDVRLLTRKGSIGPANLRVAVAVADLPAIPLIDGEVVVEDGRRFELAALQAALKAATAGSSNVLISVSGRNLADLRSSNARPKPPARGRPGPIKYSAHFEDDGAVVLRHACDMSLEGIVSKRQDAPYRSGRSETFIKTKCANAQEFVVGGYSPSRVLPRAIGALVVGYYDDGQLIYAGRIGTGYTRTVARDLWKRLHPLEIDNRRSIEFHAQKLAAATCAGSSRRGLSIAFPRMDHGRPGASGGVQGRTRGQATTGRRSGAAGHDRCQGKRYSKTASRAAAETAKAMTKKTKPPKECTKRESAQRPQDIVKPPGQGVERRRCALHPSDRVYWVDVSVTKQDLADYYRSVWDLAPTSSIVRSRWCGVRMAPGPMLPEAASPGSPSKIFTP